jgi:hypothetical protein
VEALPSLLANEKALIHLFSEFLARLRPRFEEICGPGKVVPGVDANEVER